MRRCSRLSTDSSGQIHPPFALCADRTGSIPSPETAAMPRLGVNTLLRLLFVIVWLAFGPSPTQAQGLEYVKAHYTKYEYRIPMRDGVKLFTSIYVPKDELARYPGACNGLRTA